tara:strand:- start:252 stop:1046 length:795 start_codon:yes stop_codon:yes gene_type:complete
MKSLIKRLSNTLPAIYLRNSLNISPIHMSINNLQYTSVSDAFAWRTDSNFITKFKYSDILNIFYKIKDSWVEMHFYSNDFKLIKIKKIDNLEISNDLSITKEFMNGIEGYGTFYVYHFSRQCDQSKIGNDEGESIVISNRCYLGYSQNHNLFSFVHGNTLAKFKNISNNDDIKFDIVKMSFFKNQTYKIQKYFDGYDKNELFFANPTSKKIKFSIDNIGYELKNGCCKLIEISDKKIINIRSNCLFLRPTVFSYKNEYLDVHHA